GMQDPDDDEAFPLIVSSRSVYTNNKVKYVVVEAGEELKDIADGLDIRPWLLRAYNDLDKNTTPGRGDTLYIQPKRRKASVPYHVVKEGDTMRSISQQYAVKLKQLYKKNHLPAGSEPKPGDQVWLQKRKPKD
ncbi:MAG: LysM domain-containing protein, partial [Bacteroidales bacterium]|nr:LysM domain-containing protein [Bacteroidales bacterium]